MFAGIDARAQPFHDAIVERGVEDAILGDALYDRIMKGIRARVDAGKQFKPAP